MEQTPDLELEVTEEDAGRRLDVVLVSHVETLSRAKARRLTEEGEVRVNGRRARKGSTVSVGDRVVVQELPPPSEFDAAAAPDLPLSVVYEDARVVVADKPAGVPSHPLRPDEKSTMAGALVARYPEMAGVGYARREPGIVHRLDTDTSGLIVAARDAAAFEALRDALRAGRFDKHYLALCAGRLGAPGIVDFPIAAKPGDPRRVVACMLESEVARLKPQPAETELLSAEPAGEMTLVEVRARTARRHQIRAHLAAMGHPLAGDELYGGPAVAGLGRHFLHASSLRFPHPDGDREVQAQAPLPEDLRRTLDSVRSGA